MKPPIRILWNSDNRAYALQVNIGFLNFNINAPWSKPIDVKPLEKIPRKRK